MSDVWPTRSWSILSPIRVSTPTISSGWPPIGERRSVARPCIPTPMGDETLVLRMHAGNGEHLDMDRRAVACFDAALTDVGITEDPLRALLHDYFQWSTDRMAEHPDTPDTVPDRAPLPIWSWSGLVEVDG